MDNFINILYLILGILVIAVMVLAGVYFNIILKDNKKKRELEKESKTPSAINNNTTNNIKVAKEYTVSSIQDFMEFDKVEDSMIIQQENKRFLMAIECQGINYDLMSDVEKASVESGFIKFLNTLREPIQIYIQTRTVNLEKNIQAYNTRLNKIESEMKMKEYRFKQLSQREDVDEKMLQNQRMIYLRDKNLYDYGKDVVDNTKKMSLNKNILRKKYYIIIYYYYSQEGEEILAPEEIQEMAFSSLYTRAISMIRVLSGIGVTGKVLDSFDLVDLLYNAYNRDESESFGIEKAIEAGYNELYVETKDVIDKKMEAINRKIEQEALEKAKMAINEAKTKKELELEEKEENIDDLIKEIAKNIIKENENYLGTDITERSLNEIEKEGGKIDEKGQKKKTTRRAKSRV